MNIIGIICEYNPFHNGHEYHLKKVKELFPDSLIILVLNGYFLERGDVSIISKKDKTKIALLEGVDVVLELPFTFGTQSADTFASTSLKMLNELKCEYVIFGSESNDLDTLSSLADYTLKNSKEYNEKVKKYLDEGLNYPTSLHKSLKINNPLLSNDLLNLSYIKAIKMNNYKIMPIAIKRTNNYLDTLSTDDVISATNIREKLKNSQNITKYIPEMVEKYIKNIDIDNLFPILKTKIITDHHLDEYLDVNEGIQNKILKVINDVSSTNELITKIKSKRYTYNYLRRMLIHILIGLRKEDIASLKQDYIKILGFSCEGQKYLQKIKKEVSIPLTPNKNSIIYKYEMKCATIYDLILNTNENTLFEKSNKPIN